MENIRQLFCQVSLFLLMASLMACSNGEPPVDQEPEPQPASEEQDHFALQKKDLILYPIQKANKRMFRKITGRVVPRNTTQLFSEVQGKILPHTFLFKEGVAFNKGDVLIKIDSREFELNLEAQRSILFNNITDMMPDLKSDYSDNYDQWLQYIQHYQFGESLPPLPAPLTDAEKYFVTSNQVYNLFYTIKAQEERLQKYTITAPYAGTITQANIDLGSLVTPGQALGTINSRYQYELEAGMDLQTASKMKLGDVLNFHSNEVPGKWKGKVVRINNLIDPRTQNIPVYFRLSGESLRSGMYLEGDKQVKSYDAVSVIPTAAIGRDNSVLLIEKGVIVSKSIEPLEYLIDSVIINGLSEPDVLILNQFDVPMEGTKVKI